MNAYGASAEAPPGQMITVTKQKRPVLVSRNIYFVPIAIVEFLMLWGLLAMNGVLRFDPPSRKTAAMLNYSHVTLQATDLVSLNQPYYDYSLTLEENLEYADFPVTFTMMEYSFFVPAFLLPILMIVGLESFEMLIRKRPQKTVDSLGMQIMQAIRRISRFYFTYLMYGSLAGMTTIFIKLLVPVPRPHFVAVCQNMSVRAAVPLDATNTSMLCFPNIDLTDALQAFPSYHATIAMFSTAFLCLYIYYSCQVRGVPSVTGWLSLPIIVMGLIGALHRWTTHHNTFFDIIWGTVIGIVWALVAVYGILDKFRESIWSKSADPLAGAPPVGHVNEAFVPTTPLTRTEMMLSRPPPGRPAQAFNAHIDMEQDRRRGPPQNHTDYNVPRQRYSIPAAPAPPPRAAPRPASVHPGMARRHEASSYF